MLIKPGELLAAIDTPKELRQLSQSQLVQLCSELRQFIIDNVSIYGGHFGASLGVVELTVALHYAFNTQEDELVWNVGHHAYGHKIITDGMNATLAEVPYGLHVVIYICLVPACSSLEIFM
jgi:1-deoxy-D-xylulose-5-phosphate synthase